MNRDYPPTINIEKKKDSTGNNLETKNDSWLNTYILKNEKFKIQKTTFPRPFLIQTNEKQYGILNQDGLYFTDPEDFEKVKDAFYKYERLIGEMDSRTNDSQHYDPMQVDYIRETLSTINKIFNKSKKISPAFISEKNNEENPERFYEQFQNYLILLDEVNQEKIEDYFSLKFGDLSMREQFYFLNFIKDKNEEEITPIKNLTNKFGVDAFRTFLSIEQGGEKMGDQILALGDGEKIPEEVAREVFKKYREIVDIVYKVEEYLNEISVDHENINDPKIIKEIKEKLLVRGKELLSNFSKDKAEITFESLDNIKTNNELFCALLKSLKENKVKVNLLKFKDIYLEINYPQWLDASLGYENQKQQIEMLTMIYQNYKETPILAQKLVDELTDIFDGKGKNRTTIEMLKNKGEIIAFCRFEEIGDNKQYFGSFNVKEEMRGLNIGDSFLEATLNRKAEDNEILAVCHATNRIGAHYIENGFIANKFTPDYSGIPIFSIVRNDSKNNNYFKTKLFSIEKIKEIQNSNEIEVFHEKNQEELISKLEKINEGYVLTRYFNDPQTKDWYIVLEKIDFSHLE